MVYQISFSIIKPCYACNSYLGDFGSLLADFFQQQLPEFSIVNARRQIMHHEARCGDEDVGILQLGAFHRFKLPNIDKMNEYLDVWLYLNLVLFANCSQQY